MLHVGRNDQAGFFYYVMELADDVTGGAVDPETYVPHTLAWARKHGLRLSTSRVLAIGTDLARALAGLHKHTLVHRDIKPSNVIFVGGVPKLADIGLVTLATSAHTFVGTEGFVPPEGPGTPAADVFSLGKLLYEIVTGLDRHDYPRLPSNLDELTDRKELLELNEILIRACEPRAEQRYPDASALLEDLLLLQAGRSVRSIRATERRLTRSLRIGMFLALVAGIAGADAGAWIERSLRQQAEAERDDLTRKTNYSAGLAKAQRALEAGDLDTAERELNRLVPGGNAPDLRGFEWHALMHETRSRPMTVLQREGPATTFVRFSPDGRWLAVGMDDKRVALWETATWKVVRVLADIDHPSFSPDSQKLFGLDSRLALRGWSVATGALAPESIPGIQYPLDVASPAGITCVQAGQKGQPHILSQWDFTTGRELRRREISAERKGKPYLFYTGTVSADQTKAAFLFWDGDTVRPECIWETHDLDTGLKTAEGETNGDALALSPDGGALAVGAFATPRLTLYDTRTSAKRWDVFVGNSATNALSISPDGRYLAMADRDRYLWVLHLGTGNVINKLVGHKSPIGDIAWQPDRRSLVSSNTAGEVFRWADCIVPPRSMIQIASAEDRFFSTALPSPDGRSLAVTRGRQHLDLISTETMKVQATFPNTIFLHSFGSDGTTIDFRDSHWKMQTWTIEAQPRLLAESKPLVQLRCLVLPASKALAIIEKKLVQVLDWPGERPRFELRAPTTIDYCRIADDLEYIFTENHAERRMRLWDRHQALVGEVSYTNVITAVTFDQRNRWIALGYADGMMEVRRVPDLQVLRTWHIGTGSITAIAPAPLGDRLFTGSAFGTVHIFSTDDWREIGVWSAAENQSGNRQVRHLRFSANESLLTAYYANGHVRIWRHADAGRSGAKEPPGQGAIN